MAENLGALRVRLTAGDFHLATVGQLLSDFRAQGQRLVDSDVQLEVADNLSQLSILFSSEGDSLSGG